MTMDSDAELRATYADLLEREADAQLVHLIDHLDTGYRVVDHGAMPLPPRLSPRSRDRWGRPPWYGGTLRDRPRHVLRYGPLIGLSALTVVLAIAVLLFNQAVASDNILDLGKPTSDVPTNYRFPLSGFHRAGPFLRSHGRPELLWIGTAWPGDTPSDFERWPLIKALTQFGSFFGIAPARPSCGQPVSGFVSNGKPTTETPCSPPTFDWSHARYTSRYITFVPRDVIDARGHASFHLTAPEVRLFDRYVRLKPGNSLAALSASIYIGPTVNMTAKQELNHYPLIDIGRYLQTVSQVPLSGDLTGYPAWYPAGYKDPTHAIPPALYYFHVLTFDQVRSALARGKLLTIPGPSGYPPTTYPGLIPDVNAEANVITALICHADGSKPGKVCGRPVIRTLLKHVK
jgi:hypothetical protein